MAAPESEIVFRPLDISDYDRGFIRLLSQLTSVGDCSKSDFERLFERLRTRGTQQRTIVYVNPTDGQICATGSLFLECKFTHKGGICGHIEDVVVDETVRGKHLGVRVIEELIKIARAEGCYKVILDCSRKNVPFYERCGFTQKELQMRFDLLDQ